MFGVGFCLGLSEVFKFHNFDNLSTTKTTTAAADESRKIDPRAKTKAVGSEDLTHLVYAAASNRIMDVRRMIARGVNLSTPDYDGRTALHLAASEGHYEVAVLLLSFDVDLNPRDRFGNTPADDAKAKGHQRIVDLIDAASKPRSAFGVGGGGGGESPSMDDVSSNSSRLMTRHTHNLLLSLSKDGALKCTKADLAMSMFNNGLLHSKRMDANFGRISNVLHGLPKEIDEVCFSDILHREPLLADALRGELAIPGWEQFKKDLQHIFEDCKACEDGEVGRVT